MAVTNSIQNVTHGFGISGLQYKLAASSAGAATPIAVTATLPTGQVINYGYARIKISAVDGAHGMSSVTLTGTDGTTTEYVDSQTALAGTNGQGGNFVFQICSDLNLNAFTATVALAAGGTATVNLEVAGNEAAGGP